jgi:hypothetical protein
MSEVAFIKEIIEEIDGQTVAHTQTRFETNPTVIDVIRALTGDQAWIELPTPPSYDAMTERIDWDGNDWVVTELNQAQKDAKQAELAVLRKIQFPPLSRRQFKLVLLNMSVLASVEALVSNSSSELKIWWNDTVEFHRDHALVASFAAQSGLNSEQVDGIWTAGKDL